MAKRKAPVDPLAEVLERIRAGVESDNAQGGARCITCSLPPPVLAMVRSLAASDHPLACVARHLRKNGYKIRDGALQAHFRDHESRGDENRG